MSAVFEWLHTVTPDEVDELGHANNEVYLRWMNQAAVAHSAALGWSFEGYARLGHGWVVRRHEIEYLRPAPPGAPLVIRTWVRTMDRATSWRCHQCLLLPERQLAARAQTLWAWINYRTGRPGRIPPEVASAFPVVAEEVFAARA